MYLFNVKSHIFTISTEMYHMMDNGSLHIMIDDCSTVDEFLANAVSSNIIK